MLLRILTQLFSNERLYFNGLDFTAKLEQMVEYLDAD